MGNARKFLTTLIALGFAAMAGCGPPINKEEFRRNITAIYGKGDLGLIDKLFAPDFVSHWPDQDLKGPESEKQGISMLRAAFPDFQFHLEDLVIEGDRVALRFTWHGTNKAPLKIPGGEIPATGKQVAGSGMAFWRIKDGKIVEEFELGDTLGVMQQLGVIPTGK